MRREGDAEAEANVLGDLAQRAEDHFRRRTVGAVLAEVMLHHPDGVESDLVGELDLLERLPVRPLLGVSLVVRMREVRPRIRRVDLVQQVKLHRRLLSPIPVSPTSSGL